MEINDFTLRKLSLAVSLAGILALFLFSVLNEAREVKAWEIDESLLGEKVRVSGSVEWRKYTGNVLLFNIKDLELVTCVIIGPRGIDLAEVVEGVDVEVEGVVDKYEGKVEVVAHEVRVLGGS